MKNKGIRLLSVGIGLLFLCQNLLYAYSHEASSLRPLLLIEKTDRDLVERFKEEWQVRGVRKCYLRQLAFGERNRQGSVDHTREEGKTAERRIPQDDGLTVDMIRLRVERGTPADIREVINDLGIALHYAGYGGFDYSPADYYVDLEKYRYLCERGILAPEIVDAWAKRATELFEDLRKSVDAVSLLYYFHNLLILWTFIDEVSEREPSFTRNPRVTEAVEAYLYEIGEGRRMRLSQTITSFGAEACNFISRSVSARQWSRFSRELQGCLIDMTESLRLSEGERKKRFAKMFRQIRETEARIETEGPRTIPEIAEAYANRCYDHLEGEEQFSGCARTMNEFFIGEKPTFYAVWRFATELLMNLWYFAAAEEVNLEREPIEFLERLRENGLDPEIAAPAVAFSIIMWFTEGYAPEGFSKNELVIANFVRRYEGAEALAAAVGLMWAAHGRLFSREGLFNFADLPLESLNTSDAEASIREMLGMLSKVAPSFYPRVRQALEAKLGIREVLPHRAYHQVDALDGIADSITATLGAI